jgi:hypothetical protein
MERYLTRIGKISQCLAVSHAVPARSWEVTVVLWFISERSAVCMFTDPASAGTSSEALQQNHVKFTAIININPLKPKLV